MLITCSECQKQVSNKASACPSCGAPISARAIDTPVQTTERTSKRLKLHTVVSAILCGIGVILVMAGNSDGKSGPSWEGVFGVMLFVFALFWFIITRIRIWWYHG